MKAQIKSIFKSYPSVNELFVDASGNVWTDLATAEGQSKGGKVKVLKRTDYLTEKKDKK